MHIYYSSIYCDRHSDMGCDKAVSKGICAASTRTGPLFSFPTTSLLCCWLSVCSSVCLSVCSRPGFICILPAHPYSWWKRVTPRGDACVHVCVCRCVCVQDLIGLWSEGILHTESQVEREQGSHCFEHYAFSIVSPLPPPAHISAPAATAQDAFSSG